jgi:hypothetical protein
MRVRAAYLGRQILDLRHVALTWSIRMTVLISARMSPEGRPSGATQGRRFRAAA